MNMTTTEALHAGATVRPPRGATFCRAETAGGKCAVVNVRDLDTLAGAGPFVRVTWGIKARKGEFVAGPDQGARVTEPEAKPAATVPREPDNDPNDNGAAAWLAENAETMAYASRKTRADVDGATEDTAAEFALAEAEREAADDARAERLAETVKRQTLEAQAGRVPRVGQEIETTGDLFDRLFAVNPLFATPTPTV